jgi:hypothetical protein
VNPAEARLASLMNRLDFTLWQLQQDQACPAGPLRALLEDAVALAPELDEPGRLQLAHRVATLNHELQAAHARLGARLRGLAAGRRAVHGYHAAPPVDSAGALLRTRA